jgi:transcriptional regulator with XRE-family HTH domain
MTVGGLIRERRERRGWSQEVLCDRLGMKQSYLSRLERDKVGLPQRPTLEKIGALLGISLPEFYRAAGVLEGIDVEATPTPAAGTLQPRDSDHLTVAEMVADIEARKGEWFQRTLAEAKERLTPAQYEDFCVNLWRMFEGNSIMAFGLFLDHEA